MAQERPSFPFIMVPLLKSIYGFGHLLYSLRPICTGGSLPRGEESKRRGVLKHIITLEQWRGGGRLRSQETPPLEVMKDGKGPDPTGRERGN